MHQQQFAFFSLFLLLATVFITSNSPVKSSLLERIHDRLVERSRAFIHKLLLGDLEHNPNETIVDKHFPDSGDLLRSQSPELDKCYSAAVVDGVRMSIFEHPIGKIIHEFLHDKNLTHSGGHSDETVASKVKNVLRSLKNIAQNVYNCIHRLNDTSFKPTKLGLTHFASMSQEEIAAIYQKPLKLRRSKKKKNNDTTNSTSGGHAALGSSGGGGGNDGPAVLGSRQKPHIRVPFDITQEDLYKEYPDTHDYRDQGVVSEVKNQGGCSFCFIFGSVAAMESSLMLNSGQRGISLSEMDIIDCMVAHKIYKPTDNKEYHVPDCEEGGAPTDVFAEAYLVGMTPNEQARPFVLFVEKSEPYPYNIESCGADPVIARVTSYASQTNIEEDEQRLKAVLMKYGPLTVFLRTHLEIDTKKNSGNFYNLLDKDNLACDTTKDPSHVVLLVGWDENYWIIKNSYGNAQVDLSDRAKHGWERPWGIEGYLYLGKEVAASCGIFGKDSGWYFPFMELSQQGDGYNVQPSYSGQEESSNGGGGGDGMYDGSGSSYSGDPFWSYSAASYPELQNSESQRAALYPWLQNPSYDWRSAPSNPESSFVFNQMADLAEEDEAEDGKINFELDNRSDEDYMLEQGGGGGGYPWY